jgi:hypothetical protein
VLMSGFEAGDLGAAFGDQGHAPGWSVDGGFADKFLAEATGLMKLPDGVDFLQAGYCHRWRPDRLWRGHRCGKAACGRARGHHRTRRARIAFRASAATSPFEPPIAPHIAIGSPLMAGR